MDIKNILVPTDYSVSAGAAITYARHIAARTRATVHLLHIIEGVLAARERASVSPMGAEDMTEGRGGGNMLTVLKQAREAAPAILEYQRSNEIDLIVMGTHGHRSIGRFLNGSDTSWTMGETTERILQAAPCPVMTVGPRANMRPEEVDRLLVVVDRDDEAPEVLQEAAALAKLFGAEVDLLLWDQAESATPQPATSSFVAGGEASGGFTAFLSEAIAKAAPEARLYRAHGRLYQAAVDFARHQDTRLIVSGPGLKTRGRERFKGGNADFVVRAAPCPVYTLRG
jgi:nucleotide-binding universal stress UspA family protein